MSNLQWKKGDWVVFGTFDHPHADTRDLDGTIVTIVDVAPDREEVYVDTIYGGDWYDQYNFIKAASRG